MSPATQPLAVYVTSSPAAQAIENHCNHVSSSTKHLTACTQVQARITSCNHCKHCPVAQSATHHLAALSWPFISSGMRATHRFLPWVRRVQVPSCTSTKKKNTHTQHRERIFNRVSRMKGMGQFVSGEKNIVHLRHPHYRFFG